MFLKSLLILFITLNTFADYDPCKYISLKSCGNRFASNKSIGSSQPSVNRSFSAPSSLAMFRGFGVESIFFDGADFSIVAGSGRVGAGATSTNTDDTFFGNTSKEYTPDYEFRKADGSKYTSDKFSLAFGTTLLGRKKSNYKLNVGLSAKYFENTESIYIGYGGSIVLGPVNAGYSKYRDEGENDAIDNQVDIFDVTTMSVGLNLPYVNLDWTVFESDLDNGNKVEIYSAGIFLNSWMISFGRRKELSSRRKYNFEKEVFESRQKDWSSFVGAQYNYNKRATLGLLSNYYLNRELSFIMTIFL